jgi:hypothetical protein
MKKLRVVSSSCHPIYSGNINRRTTNTKPNQTKPNREILLEKKKKKTKAKKRGGAWLKQYSVFLVSLRP